MLSAQTPCRTSSEDFRQVRRTPLFTYAWNPNRPNGRTISVFCLSFILTWTGFFNLEAGERKKSASDNKVPVTETSPQCDGLSGSELFLLNEVEKLKLRLSELEARLAGDHAKRGVGIQGQFAPRSNATPPEPAAASQMHSAIVPDEHPSPELQPELGTSSLSGTLAVVDMSSQISTPKALPENMTPKKAEPFAFADFTWLTGNPRTKDSPIDSPVFTGELRVDTAYHYSFNRPTDHTIVGSSEVFRSNEIQLTQFGIGGDFHYQNVRGRLMTQFGMYSQTTPRNDSSPARGQWNLDSAYRYVSEAYGGYHWDKLHGINVDAGIFMSYVGLYSYYQFDNWAYQPSYVSSNTPWFFTGVRVQIFPSEKLKIEPWFINGWQSYGKFNKAPGIGGQILWRPNGSISILANNYWGTDTLGNPDRKRIHTDDSIQVKYIDSPDRQISKGAFTLTIDAGCEYGGGVSCTGSTAQNPAQYFLGIMAYNRLWFHKDIFALTLGGGAITNPGRYLVLIPPINGATAYSGTPYFTANPGDKYRAWDSSITFDYMPTQFSTFRFEYNHRASNVPYFAGEGGVTPPGGNVGAFGSVVPDFAPDLRKYERRFTIALLVKL